MLKDKLKDAAESLNNILNQPLQIPGIEEKMTLLQALEKFHEQQPENSNLSKMLRTLSSNPEPTQALIQELQLIIRDLQAS